MTTARTRNTATRLQDGRVLVTGGTDATGQLLASTEIFDPAHNTWSPGPKMSVPRANHTAVLLDNGQVIVIGGGQSDSSGLPSGQGVLASTEIYSPASNTFSPGPQLLHARGHQQSTLLPDGRVLVAGGTGPGGTNVLEAEVLSADHKTWSAAGSLTQGRSLFGLAQTTSGQVVVAGGLASTILGSTERFDPSTNQWSQGPSLMQPRFFLALAALSDGGVFAAGGIGGPNNFLDSTEVLAAGGSAWSAGPAFIPASPGSIAGGSGVMLVGLSKDRVLAAGGYGLQASGYTPVSFSGVFDAAKNQWTRTSSLDTPRSMGRAIELDDHRVLLIGGIGKHNAPTQSCSITTAPVE